MITSLTEMLELGHMTTLPYNLSHMIKLLVTPWTNIMMSQPLFKNTCILRRLEVTIFVDIVKIVTIFKRTTFKDSNKAKIIKNYASKCNLYLNFLI